MNLSHNSISRVGDCFGRESCLTNLRHLDLSHNKIEDIDEAFFENARSLRWLDLKYNRLLSLSSAFQKLSSLSHLSLFANRITCLPVFLLDMNIDRLEFEWDIMVDPFMKIAHKTDGQPETTLVRKRVEDSLVDLRSLKVFMRNTVHTSAEFVRFQHFLSFKRTLPTT